MIQQTNIHKFLLLHSQFTEIINHGVGGNSNFERNKYDATKQIWEYRFTRYNISYELAKDTRTGFQTSPIHPPLNTANRP